MQYILEIIRSLGPQELSVLFAFISTVTAIGSVFAALFSSRSARDSARISSQQYKLQIVMAQLVLYERILSVYNGVNDFIESITASEEIESEKRNESLREARVKFNKTTSEVCFIFDDIIQDYIHELSSKEVALRQALRRLSSYPTDSEERQKYERERHELFTWFAEQSLRVREKFTPYLAIDLPLKLERETLYHQYKVSLGTQKKSIFNRLLSRVRRTDH